MRASRRHDRLELFALSLLLLNACGSEAAPTRESTTPVGSGGTGGASGQVGMSGASGQVAMSGVGAAGAPAAGNAGMALAGSAGTNGTAGTAGSASGSGGSGETGGGGATSGSGGMSGGAGTSGSGGMSGSGGSAGTAGSSGSSGSGGSAGTSGSGGTAGSSGTGGSGGSAGTPAKFVGNITTGGRVRSDFIELWDQLTPENEGKWGSVERTRDTMSWGGLDAAYQYAKEHKIPFKQHTFVWGSQQPSWIAGLSQADQRAEVEEWIRLYCERYPDTQLIDVVNEPPPHTTPPYMNALGGAGASGFDWIVQSFKWAHQYCPNAILILNDYNTIEYQVDNDRFLDIVKKVKAAGAPIDAIGAQAHDAFKIPTATVKMYIDKLAATGLPVYITEYDIDMASDDQQRQVMTSQITMFWNHDKVPGITLWGYIEGQTWRPNTGLMTDGGNQRPAMMWLMDFLKR